MNDLYRIGVQTLDGEATTLEPHRGRVLLIVNTASRCGFTPQYEGLEALHRKYEERGLSVLGFPCNQFGAQEPGDAQDIRQFCRDNYQVTFPMYGKIEVNGPSAHPLFQLLKREAKGLLGTQAIKWNFTKFLVDRQGHVKSRHAPSETPASLEPKIEALLG